MPGCVTAILLIGIAGRFTSSALSMVTYSRTGSPAPAAVDIATAAASPITAPRTSFRTLIGVTPSVLRGGRLGPSPVVASEQDLGRLVAAQHRNCMGLDPRRWQRRADPHRRGRRLRRGRGGRCSVAQERGGRRPLGLDDLRVAEVP